MSRKRIVVLGFMGSCPISGVVWQHLHYIAGLRDLGHEVFYIEDSARLPYNPETFETSEDYDHAARTLQRLSIEYDFKDRWAFRPHYLNPPDRTAGLSLARIRELYKEADALLNVCGSQEITVDLQGNDRLIYVESDPGVEQIKIDNGSDDTRCYLASHRKLFTFGENVGANPSEFPVPLHGIEWLPTRQPVATRFWQTADPPPPGASFSTIANWSTSGRKDIEWRDNNYLWSKSLEFLKFIEAPMRSHEPFEMATDIPDPDVRQRFLQANWCLVPPHRLSASFDAYRSYIQKSKGEFTAAKDQYVRLKTGWFSDRSACYLAAGRPVITQDTGFTKNYGGGPGLLAFTSVDEIPELVRSINCNYTAHANAALQIAQEYFEASKVLASLLERAGV